MYEEQNTFKSSTFKAEVIPIHKITIAKFERKVNENKSN